MGGEDEETMALSVLYSGSVKEHEGGGRVTQHTTVLASPVSYRAHYPFHELQAWARPMFNTGRETRNTQCNTAK